LHNHLDKRRHYPNRRTAANRNLYAELNVRAGKHLLTLQPNLDGNIESVKPGVLNLAKAVLANLR
jgi:hypothetical protein